MAEPSGTGPRHPAGRVFLGLPHGQNTVVGEVKRRWSVSDGKQPLHRDAALIVVGDLDSANLKRALPNFHQHITCPTRGKRTLDHCYTTFKNSYKAQSRPPFGKSDHATIFLMPVYKQRLKQEAPVQREVARWTDQSVAALQDALDDADWDMIRRSSDDVNMFTEAVVGFIGKLTDDTVQKNTIRTFPNQKPSAFNTIIPSTLTSKLEVLGLSLPLCQWISNFLTDRPQAVRVKKHTSSTLTLSTGAPQGCVLSPLLYSLYTYDCVASFNPTTIIKFADDTVVVCLISNNDETAYLQEFGKNLERWCQENNLLLNVSKTKELIVDFSTKQDRSYQPLNICGTPVERVDSSRYLGVHIKQDLSWSCHINTLVKKARQRLYHLRRLRDFKLPSQVLKTFYTCTIESVLTGSITSWFGNSTMQDRRALQRVVRSAERTIHTELPDLQDIYSMCTFIEHLNIFSSATSSSTSCLSLNGTVSNPYNISGLTTVL
ncbi:gastrula zinc finger protein XlCGF28.1-like [Silurus asotus]|uniref:Gastrula zinc finger protein XlCGF28.1-like n=1 Tax=Silurus asotus TaxID=30991 RepID=A0AAD5A578_SILAS|nr:gastrula zinc finger protein XlCGF28.1-like [Silurus asotus]